MKKIYFYVLGLCLFPFLQAYAQTQFAPLGARWTYHGINGWGSMGEERLNHFECIDEQMLNAKLVKTIKVRAQRQELRDGSSGGIFYTNRDTTTSYYEVYQSGDTVYYNNPVFQQFTPLYIFNVQEGDTIHLPVTDTFFLTHNGDPRDSTMSFRIDSIRMVNYGGASLKTYYTTTHYDEVLWGQQPLRTTNPLFNWAYDIVYKPLQNPLDTNMIFIEMLMKGAYTEVWGGVGNGLVPMSYPFINGGLFDGYFPIVKFNCYESGDTSIVWNPQASCDTFSYNKPLSIKDNILARHTQVYPNPVQYSLKIKTSTAMPAKATAYLTDLLGRIVISSVPLKPGTEQVLDVSSLNAGIYILVIEAGGQKGYQKITIRR